jgi:acetoacetyl-CoA synthetase
VPDTVVLMPGVPRNMTGKKLELPVKKILQGANPESVVSRGAMSNPDVLAAYLDYAASRP